MDRLARPQSSTSGRPQSTPGIRGNAGGGQRLGMTRPASAATLRERPRLRGSGTLCGQRPWHSGSRPRSGARPLTAARFDAPATTLSPVWLLATAGMYGPNSAISKASTNLGICTLDGFEQVDLEAEHLADGSQSDSAAPASAVGGFGSEVVRVSEILLEARQRHLATQHQVREVQRWMMDDGYAREAAEMKALVGGMVEDALREAHEKFEDIQCELDELTKEAEDLLDNDARMGALLRKMARKLSGMHQKVGA
eukprot:gnl/TRDRNA2_/TRDRNA2_184615_c0_seq1.p1 gnl/TRDRNA2_/TRDRNA2_184615_c0~~gnl/TRDRNA2_/TRDRNA2_184615_c0_seq1.p1  ORF type:complete len:254 (+),score=33.98 gnl/TRDRNA2_/TRDRNA2_184615_c0_seq1:83-844(+)